MSNSGDVDYEVLENNSELGPPMPECFGGISPRRNHPGFVYMDPGRTSNEPTAEWLSSHAGIDPRRMRVVEWHGPREATQFAIRPVIANMQRPGFFGGVGHLVMWYALSSDGPAVVELSADTAPVAGRMAAAWGPGVLTVIGHLALPRLR